MNIKTVTKKGYLNAVRSKLQKAAPYLMHGPLGPQKGLIRDELGLQVSFSNILAIAENLFEANQGQDVVANRIANFSGAGFADVSDVQTVGAIDVTIMTLANSLIPFIAVDRSMANPVDTVYYNNLVAVNSAAGVAEGDVVVNNFANPNSNVVLGPSVKVLTATGTSSTASSGTSTDFATYLIPGSVVVTITVGGNTFTGRDFDSDGKVYFNGIAVASTVNYQTGVVSFSTLANGAELSVRATEDVTSDAEGTGILKIKADYVPTQLETHPKSIILEQNAHSMAYMNKILAQAQSVQMGGDYTNLHFQRISSIYTEDVNRDLLKLLVAMAAGDSTPVTLNLSTYGVNTFAQTKDDLVNRFIINMRTSFLSNTGVAPTVIVCGSKACAELESNPEKWVSSPTFYTQQNGLAGTFNGMPVFRHNYLDSIETAGKATFYMAAKLPDNSSGSLVFGEYLPLMQTGTVGNYNNPLQSSTGMFSQVGSKIIQSTLVKKGQITY